MLIGSWTTVFYKMYFKNWLRLSKFVLVTRDLDFLIDRPRKNRKIVNIPHLLEDLGFIVSFKGSKGYMSLVHPDLIIEFLTPERGKGLDHPVPLLNLGMNATALRFLDFLSKDTIQLTVESFVVTLPHPARFAVHKLIVAQRRTNKDKAQKDNRVALDILNDLIDGGQAGLIRSVYEDISPRWRKKTEEALRNLDGIRILDVLNEDDR